MWTQGGYGDSLEARTPGLRRMHEEAGAPEGFTDCIGWLIENDGPSRWNVTFAVDDTDASAARAAELGGEILVAPYRRRARARRPGQGPAGRAVHDQLLRLKPLARAEPRPARAAGAGCPA